MARRTFICLAAAAGALVIAGCGSGGDDPAPAARSATVEASDTGYEMPDQVAGGVVAMRFRNVGAQPHAFDLARVEGDHTAAEVAGAVREARQGAPAPWLEDVAGPPLLTPGGDITITRALDDGTYVLFDSFPDTRGVAGTERGLLHTFTVAGDSGATLPAADAVITAEKSRYDVPPLAAGTHTIELRNAAAAEREFTLASVNPGRTEADVGRWAQSIGTTGRLPATPVPATFLGAIQTIPAGTSVFLTVTLEAGREYALNDESGLMARFTPR